MVNVAFERVLFLEKHMRDHHRVWSSSTDSRKGKSNLYIVFGQRPSATFRNYDPLSQHVLFFYFSILLTSSELDFLKIIIMWIWKSR